MSTESLQWSDENTDLILKRLSGKQPRVEECVLRKEIAKVPEAMFPILYAEEDSRSNRDQRATFRKFGEKWFRLSNDCRHRLLTAYDAGIEGAQGRHNLLRWLTQNMDEETGLNDEEKRGLRTLRFALDGFDLGMCLRLSLDAGRILSSKSPGTIIATDECDAMDAMAEAALLRGRKSIPKDQQSTCSELKRIWQELGKECKREAIRLLDQDSEFEVQFSDFFTILGDIRALESEGGEDLALCIERIKPETRGILCDQCKLRWGSGTVRKDMPRSIYTLTELLTRTAGILGSSPVPKTTTVKGNQKYGMLVSHCAWLMVLSGFDDISVSETGKFANLLNESITLCFPHRTDLRLSWRDAIEDALGKEQERYQIIQGYIAKAMHLKETDTGISQRIRIELKK